MSTHIHSYSRSKPTAAVETCSCGKFRFTEHAGPSIEGIEEQASLATHAVDAKETNQ